MGGLTSFARAAAMALFCCLALKAGAFAVPPIRRQHRPHSRQHELSTLPEHLIDCAANPVLADLYGGADSPYCFQRTMGPFSGAGSLLEQTFTMGFLVAVYYFFRRTRGGVKDWMEVQLDEKDLEEEDEFFRELRDDLDVDAYERLDRNRRKNVNADADLPQRCPQCDGRGRFSWNDNSEGDGEAQVCSICLGVGTIALRNTNRKSSRIKVRPAPRALPGRAETVSFRDGDEE